MTVVVIVITSSVDKRKHPRGRPWELVAGVPLSAVIQLEDDPEEQRKHMGIQEAENDGNRNLSLLIFTILANMCSIGWQYSPTMLNGASYS